LLQNNIWFWSQKSCFGVNRPFAALSNIQLWKNVPLLPIILWRKLYKNGGFIFSGKKFFLRFLMEKSSWETPLKNVLKSTAGLQINLKNASYLQSKLIDPLV
jgi:hypothetical protein